MSVMKVKERLKKIGLSHNVSAPMNARTGWRDSLTRKRKKSKTKISPMNKVEMRKRVKEKPKIFTKAAPYNIGM